MAFIAGSKYDHARKAPKFTNDEMTPPPPEIISSPDNILKLALIRSPDPIRLGGDIEGYLQGGSRTDNFMTQPQNSQILQEGTCNNVLKISLKYIAYFTSYCRVQIPQYFASLQNKCLTIDARY